MREEGREGGLTGWGYEVRCLTCGIGRVGGGDGGFVWLVSKRLGWGGWVIGGVGEGGRRCRWWKKAED